LGEIGTISHNGGACQTGQLGNSRVHPADHQAFNAILLGAVDHLSGFGLVAPEGEERTCSTKIPFRVLPNMSIAGGVTEIQGGVREPSWAMSAG